MTYRGATLRRLYLFFGGVEAKVAWPRMGRKVEAIHHTYDICGATLRRLYLLFLFFCGGGGRRVEAIDTYDMCGATLQGSART
jgi:hypothetical protein